MTLNNLIPSNLINFLKFHSSITLSLLTVTFCLRCFELIQMVWIKPLTNNSLNAELIGIISDLGAFSLVAIVYLGIGCLFFWNKIAYKSILFLFSVVYIVINLSTVLFFLTALVPMDQSMFTYSIEEMFVIVKSTQLGLTGILFIIFPFIIFSLSFLFLQKKNTPVWLVSTLLVIGLIGAKPLVSDLITNEVNLHNKRIALNKADYFMRKVFQHFQKEDNTTNSPIRDEKITAQNQFIKFRQEDIFYQKASNESNIPKIKGINLEQYPFIHQNKYNPLKDYFKEIREKPNVVFIIVESLGQRFFDKQKNPISFTPFLDSLKDNSLYWNNCFSSSERTFGVLPSILGSLPYGQKGFNDLANIPEHLSLTSLLQNNGYYSSFFYGGWIGFHGMERLLKKQKFDFLSYRYPSSYKKIAANKDGFSWGYADHLMMDRSFFVIDSLKKSPMLNVYLTLSTHSPFIIPNRDKHEQYIKNQLKKVGKKGQHEMILKNIEPFISVVYSDQSIRTLFDEYKNRGLYDNTIFVITGDHVMHELGTQSESEIYNVPLIIHSPLLTKTEEFNSVNSHHDIAPSLVNLLAGQNIIKTPEIFNWMGYGLEPNNEPNSKFIPLMQNNKGIKACVYKNHFYSTNSELYKFNNGQHPTKTENKELQSEIEKRLNNFKQVNAYTCLNNFICPIDIAYYNKSFELVTKQELFSNINIGTNDNWESEKITLDANLDDLIVDIYLKMFYKDTLPNPNIGIKIYDESNKYLDYFILKNDLYTSSNYDIKKNNSFQITRLIHNQNDLFKKENQFSFFIEKSKKEILVENFRVIVKGFKNTKH